MKQKISLHFRYFLKFVAICHSLWFFSPTVRNKIVVKFDENNNLFFFYKNKYVQIQVKTKQRNRKKCITSLFCTHISLTLFKSWLYSMIKGKKCCSWDGTMKPFPYTFCCFLLLFFSATVRIKPSGLLLYQKTVVWVEATFVLLFFPFYSIFIFLLIHTQSLTI